MQEASTILLGRRTYDGFRKFWFPLAAGGVDVVTIP
jgi:dihydrofolate reductase